MQLRIVITIQGSSNPFPDSVYLTIRETMKSWPEALDRNLLKPHVSISSVRSQWRRHIAEWVANTWWRKPETRCRPKQNVLSSCMHSYLLRIPYCKTRLGGCPVCFFFGIPMCSELLNLEDGSRKRSGVLTHQIRITAPEFQVVSVKPSPGIVLFCSYHPSMPGTGNPQIILCTDVGPSPFGNQNMWMSRSRYTTKM